MRTGSLSLDLLLDGYQPGMLYEFHGEEGSCKTTLALIGAAACQGNMLPVLLCTEPMDPRRAEMLGVDMSQALYTACPYVEDLARVVHRIRQPAFIVVDSLSLLISREENPSLYTGMERTSWCVRRMLKALQVVCAATGSVAVVTSQIRASPGVGIVTTAWRAVDEMCPYRLKLSRLTSYVPAIHATVLRDPNHFPGQRVSIPVGCTGLNHGTELLWLAMQFGIVQQRGSWYYFQEERLGQGRIEAATSILQYRDVLTQLLLGDPA